MKLIKASDFKRRSELENYVRDHTGLTTRPKDSVQIVGTVKELKALSLGAGSTFWGIKVAADEPMAAISVTKPDRGELKPFGINTTKKIKKRK